MLKAFQKLGLEKTWINQKNEFVTHFNETLQGEQIATERKFCTVAQKIKTSDQGNRSIYFGTVLLNIKLDAQGQYLKIVDKEKLEKVLKTNINLN